MPSNHSIPLQSQVNGVDVGGTGFLVRQDGENYLVTVAHLPTGLNEPSTEWSTWNPELRVGVSGQPVIPLFGATTCGASSPRFRFLRTANNPSKVIDVIMLPVRAEWHWVGAFEAIDLSRVRNPMKDETACGTGYPVGTHPWPVVHTIRGPVVDVFGYVLEVDMTADEGFSGGPVMTEDGYFLGMMMGVGHEGRSHTRIIPPGIIRLTIPLVHGFADAGAQSQLF